MKILLLSLLLSSVCLSQGRLNSYTLLNVDNSKQLGLRYYNSWTNKYKNNEVSIMSGFRHYSQDSSQTFNDIRFNITKKSIIYLNWNFSYIQYNNWKTMLFDGILRYNKGPFTIESYNERESLGTPLTNYNKITSLFLALSIDYKFNNKNTIIFGYSKNMISDGNNRNYILSRYLRNIKETPLYFDLKVSHMSSGVYSPYYFSPDQLSEFTNGYGYVNEIKKDKLYLRVYMSSGIQIIDEDINRMFISNFIFRALLNDKLFIDISYGLRNVNDYYYNYGTFKISYSTSTPHILRSDNGTFDNQVERYYRK